MRTRLELSEVLNAIPGSKKAYFQPPASVKMVYPCIVYEKDKENVKHANNLNYVKMGRYKITVIDTNPDSTVPDAVGELDYCEFDRHYVSDNLHHFVYELYF